jgi:hypothetical protein
MQRDKASGDGAQPTGSIELGPLALRRSSFLLEPGGQDFVGSNSYDDTSGMDE